MGQFPASGLGHTVCSHLNHSIFKNIGRKQKLDHCRILVVPTRCQPAKLICNSPLSGYRTTEEDASRGVPFSPN